MQVRTFGERAVFVGVGLSLACAAGAQTADLDWSTVASGGMGSSTQVAALVEWDRGGPGDCPPVLVATGSFTSIGSAGAAIEGIAVWDGAAWSPLGGGLLVPPNQQEVPNPNGGQALLVWDEDGPGELRPAVYVAGNFTQVRQEDGSLLTVNGVARWGQDPAAPGNAPKWFALDDAATGAGLLDIALFNPAGQVIHALTVWDPDGAAGPLAPGLYAGGFFVGGPAAGQDGFVARWDRTSSSWSLLASDWVRPDGFLGEPGIVFELEVFNGELFAGGAISRNVQGGSIGEHGLYTWSGSAWSVVAFGVLAAETGPPPTVNALATLDVGNGTALYVGGVFGRVGADPSVTGSGIVTNNTAIFNLQGAWNSLNGPQGTVQAITSFDHDDDPGTADVLVVGGTFTKGPKPAETALARIAILEGGAWVEPAGGLDVDVNGMGSEEVLALASIDMPTAGATPPALFVGGFFNRVGFNGPAPEPASLVASLTLPTIDRQPRAIALPTNFGDATFTVSTTGPSPSYQWEHRPIGSGIWSPVGASAPTLVIPAATLSAADLGHYRVVVTFNSGAGPVLTSEEAALFCEGDANKDGEVMMNDTTAVLSSWLHCFTSGSGDGEANADGVANFGDITVILQSFGRSCP